MGNFVSLFESDDPEISFIMCGIDGAGKTTLLNNMRLGDVKKSVPRSGFKFEIVKYKNLNLHSWDVGGRDKTRPVGYMKFIPQSHGTIYVIDSSDQSRIIENKEELERYLDEDVVKNNPILFVANKQDVENCMTIEEIKNYIEFDKIDHQNKKIIGTMATDSESINEIFYWMYDCAKEEISKHKSEK